jgi:hypothetical protein
MAPRARIPLLCVYALLAACGLISLFSPLGSLEDVVTLEALVRIWGLFFLVGGVTAFTALITRTIRGHALGWWYIEIAGISLLATSTFIYASVVLWLALSSNAWNLGALACLVLGLASSLIGRAWDAYHIAKLEQKLMDELTQRDRRI